MDTTIADLQSEFLVLPRGEAFLEYVDFREGYEELKGRTSAFAEFDEAHVRDALTRNSRAFVVLRAMLGLTPPNGQNWRGPNWAAT